MAEKDDDRDEKDEAAKGGDGDEQKAEEKPEASAEAAKEEADEEAKEDAKTEAKEEAKSPAKRSTKSGRGPGGSRARAQAKQGTSLGKSMILFLVIILGIGGGIALLGREDAPPGPNKPKWKVGETVDVEITLVKNDRVELGCSSPDEVGGKHCAFEAQGKAWSKGDNNDDKKLLKPYTTTDRIQFTAAGLWSEPALAPDTLPKTRFSVKCKYKVEGMIKNLAVRWEQTGQWYPNNEWYAGSVSNCQISK